MRLHGGAPFKPVNLARGSTTRRRVTPCLTGSYSAGSKPSPPNPMTACHRFRPSADWLEERGDPRAAGVRAATGEPLRARIALPFVPDMMPEVVTEFGRAMAEFTRAVPAVFAAMGRVLRGWRGGEPRRPSSAMPLNRDRSSLQHPEPSVRGPAALPPATASLPRKQSEPPRSGLV